MARQATAALVARVGAYTRGGGVRVCAWQWPGGRSLCPHLHLLMGVCMGPGTDARLDVGPRWCVCGGGGGASVLLTLGLRTGPRTDLE